MSHPSHYSDGRVASAALCMKYSFWCGIFHYKELCVSIHIEKVRFCRNALLQFYTNNTKWHICIKCIHFKNNEIVNGSGKRPFQGYDDVMSSLRDNRCTSWYRHAVYPGWGDFGPIKGSEDIVSVLLEDTSSQWLGHHLLVHKVNRYWRLRLRISFIMYSETYNIGFGTS